MNEAEFRSLLQDTGRGAWDDDVRASAAVYGGRRHLRRFRRRRAVAGGTALVLAVGVGVLVLRTAAPLVQSSVALHCSAGAGPATPGALVIGGTGGVTLAVSNPTDQVMSVRSAASSAFAVPGTSQVTLPLPAGRSVIRCGSGDPVHLTVQAASSRPCTRVSSLPGSVVERGRLVDLTRSRLGVLPAGASLRASASGLPLRRVSVLHQGALIAEAEWREMPGDDDWHLESLTRCD